MQCHSMVHICKLMEEHSKIWCPFPSLLPKVGYFMRSLYKQVQKGWDWVRTRNLAGTCGAGRSTRLAPARRGGASHPADGPRLVGRADYCTSVMNMALGLPWGWGAPSHPLQTSRLWGTRYYRCGWETLRCWVYLLCHGHQRSPPGRARSGLEVKGEVGPGNLRFWVSRGGSDDVAWEGKPHLGLAGGGPQHHWVLCLSYFHLERVTGKINAHRHYTS